MNNTPITFGNIQQTLKAFLKRQEYSSIIVLLDENTKKHCLPLLHEFEYQIIETTSGEQNKNLTSCQEIWMQMLQLKLDRNALVINLAGGVLCDMGGFSASCFKRGIDFIHIPTTLLAMVDGTIGGKTGVDLAHEKNMVGLFSPAKAILIDPRFLKTLDSRQINSGRAEMIKHGLIASDMHLENVLENTQLSDAVIQESIGIKQYIVQQDPLEQGMRKALNFGHTLGHAIESLALQNKEDILHGEAIAHGMVLALKLSIKYSKLPSKSAKEIIQRMEAIFGKYSLNKTLLDARIEIAKNDKKNTDGKINFTLLSRIGKFEINQDLSEQELQILLKQA
jgi:3-dehydroquinate synthase